jgi:hypothetical protein
VKSRLPPARPKSIGNSSSRGARVRPAKAGGIRSLFTHFVVDLHGRLIFQCKFLRGGNLRTDEGAAQTVGLDLDEATGLTNLVSLVILQRFRQGHVDLVRRRDQRRLTEAGGKGIAHQLMLKLCGKSSIRPQVGQGDEQSVLSCEQLGLRDAETKVATQGIDHVRGQHTRIGTTVLVDLQEITSGGVRGFGVLRHAQADQVGSILGKDVHLQHDRLDAMGHPASLLRAVPPAQSTALGRDLDDAGGTHFEQGARLVGLLVHDMVGDNKHVASRLVVVDEDRPEVGLLDRGQCRLQLWADLDGHRSLRPRRNKEHGEVAHAPTLTVARDQVHVDQGVAQCDQLCAKPTQGSGRIAGRKPLRLSVHEDLFRLVEDDPIAAGSTNPQASCVLAQLLTVRIPANMIDMFLAALHLPVFAALPLIGHTQGSETLTLGTVEVELDAHRDDRARSQRNKRNIGTIV